MKAVVTGPFITPDTAAPAKRIVRPSLDPSAPTVVDIPAATFERQRALGNVTSAEAHELRLRGQAEIDRKREAFEREAREIEARAMAGVEDRALIEDYESLDGLSKDALVELAVRRQLRVNTRRSEDALRKEIRAALEPMAEKALASV